MIRLVEKIKKLGLGKIQILVGIVCAAVGLKGFLLPNHFLDGGVTGISLLVNHLTGIDLSILIISLNLPFLLLAYIYLSKKLAIASLVTILLLSITIFFIEFPVITQDKLLIAIFGGVLLGTGIGFAIRGGAVLDGSEVLGIYISRKLRTSVGRIILFFNIILFTITAFVTNIEVALYSILTFLVASKTTDFVISGFEEYIGIKIISKKHESIKEAIMHRMEVGVTIYKGEGGYAKDGVVNKIDIIDTVITRLDIRKIYSIVEEIDPEAFMVEYDVNDIKGGMIKNYFRVDL